MPIVVVSDASPIRALAHLKQLALCRDLYGTVIVPAAVQVELGRATSTWPELEIASIPWFEIRTPQTSPVDLGIPADLDNGETEAIALAIEAHADLLLMDERKGTTAARRLGLATIGVFGVLLEAKRRKLIDRVMPRVDQLVNELRFLWRRTCAIGWQSWLENRNLARPARIILDRGWMEAWIISTQRSPRHSASRCWSLLGPRSPHVARG